VLVASGNEKKGQVQCRRNARLYEQSLDYMRPARGICGGDASEINIARKFDILERLDLQWRLHRRLSKLFVRLCKTDCSQLDTHNKQL
jgi:hypothetical protein